MKRSKLLFSTATRSYSVLLGDHPWLPGWIDQSSALPQVFACLPIFWRTLMTSSLVTLPVTTTLFSFVSTLYVSISATPINKSPKLIILRFKSKKKEKESKCCFRYLITLYLLDGLQDFLDALLTVQTHFQLHYLFQNQNLNWAPEEKIEQKKERKPISTMENCCKKSYLHWPLAVKWNKGKREGGRKQEILCLVAKGCHRA